jgi:flagellar assembly factor FliW
VGREAVLDDLPVLDFVTPLPGFPDLVRFVLVQLAGGEDDAVMFELRSLDDPDLRFLVANPTAFFPDYNVELDETACADLGLTDGSDALILVLLTIGDDLATATANLMAPVVVNARTRSAAQVILAGAEWPVRAALV